MADTTKTGPQGSGEAAACLAASTPAQPTLNATVCLLDALAQEGFGTIEALAQVTLLALEAPAAYGRAGASHELLAKVLTTIRDTATRIRDDINAAAEEAGHNYTGGAEERRGEARYAFGAVDHHEVNAP